MAYRSKAKSIVEAVDRSMWGIDPDNVYIRPWTLTTQACRGTKLRKFLDYSSVADYEDAKHSSVMIQMHGSARAAVIAGRYERAPSW